MLYIHADISISVIIVGPLLALLVILIVVFTTIVCAARAVTIRRNQHIIGI